MYTIAYCFAAGCVCGFLFFFGLSYFGLLGADEPRYAQVAREMFERHDWITPTLRASPGWKSRLSITGRPCCLQFFGVSDWAARLGSAVDALLMVVRRLLFPARAFKPPVFSLRSFRTAH